MSEETTTPSDASETQANDDSPETGTSPATSETLGTTPSIDDLQARIQRMDAALKKANAEAKTHRLEADELKKFKAETQAAKLSADEKRDAEQEQLKKSLTELQVQYDNSLRQAQERIVGYEVRLQAAQMGIIDPDAAARLLDWSEIEYDDDGTPTNVESLLKALLKAKPYLVASKPTPTSGGATNPSRSQTSGNQQITQEYVSRVMQSPAEYNALSLERQQEVKQWIIANARRR